MNLRSALLVLCLACVAADLPPMPPTPKKRVKAVAAPTQGSGAMQLTAKVVVPVARKYTITWQWDADLDNPATNVVFNSWIKDWTNANSNAQWKREATITRPNTNTINKNLFMHWQFVSASNTATLLESWRPKK